MLLSPTALLSNVLDPRFRGDKLSSVQKQLALSPLNEATILKLKPVPDAEVLKFGVSCSGVEYWRGLHSSGDLAALGSIVTSFPSSQAAVERVFSSTKWQVEDRERLTPDHLFEEVYIRINAKELGWQP